MATHVKHIEFGLLATNVAKNGKIASYWKVMTERMATYTVNVVIFAGGKFRENVDKTFHVGLIFTILLLFPS